MITHTHLSTALHPLVTDVYIQLDFMTNVKTVYAFKKKKVIIKFQLDFLVSKAHSLGSCVRAPSANVRNFVSIVTIREYLRHSPFRVVRQQRESHLFTQ